MFLKEIKYFEGYRFIILDVPLLFEVKFALRLISYKLVVFCNEEQQISRLIKRNPNLSEEDARLRINSQMSTKDKVKMADYCIDNSYELQSTKDQCKRLFTIFDNSRRYVKIRWGAALVAASLFYLGFLFFKKIISI